MNQQINRRIEPVVEYLVCPLCRAALCRLDDAFSCLACKRDYPIRNGKIYFVTEGLGSDSLDSLKGKLKKVLGRWYYDVGVNVFSPDFPVSMAAEIKKLRQSESRFSVYAGCGNHRFSDDVLGVDFYDYDAVDIVCDVMRLPFKDSSVDLICTRSLFEHIEDPQELIKCFHRMTKEGGYGIHLAPFLYHFHASPQDFGRFTHKGLQSLFKLWESFHVTNAAGPFTLFVLLTVEIFSRIFSFGFKSAYAVLYLLFCLILFPIKFLDFFCVRKKMFMSIAPMFLLTVEKKESRLQ
jgi:SAM-dependent methyltransferase